MIDKVSKSFSNFRDENSVSYEDVKLSFMYQNINGFIGKRSVILNSSLILNYDVVLFQETNIDTNFYDKIDNFSSIDGWSSINLTSTGSGEFCRGMLLAFNMDKLNCTPSLIYPPSNLLKFDIRAIKFELKFQSLTIISVYRSPSMSSSNMLEFFIGLSDFIDEQEGQIIVVGDLNVEKTRPFLSGYTQQYLLDMLNTCGLYSCFQGTTRQNVQLDYLFSNEQLIVSKIVGFQSDHSALTCEFPLCLKINVVPFNVSTSIKFINDSSILKIMEDSINVLLKSDNLCVGELILEYELLIHDISVNLAKVRKFSQHKRIPGKSRQLSSLVLNNPRNLSKVDKSIEYKRLLRLDASRRLLKKTFSESLATSLYSLVCLPGKVSNSTMCKIDPMLFYQKIYDDE